LVSFGSTILEIYFGRKLAVSSYNQLTVNYFRAVRSKIMVVWEIRPRFDRSYGSIKQKAGMTKNQGIQHPKFEI